MGISRDRGILVDLCLRDIWVLQRECRFAASMLSEDHIDNVPVSLFAQAAQQCTQGFRSWADVMGPVDWTAT